MIVICEECGKKYKINPVHIIGNSVKFNCKACNHQILVTKPGEASSSSEPDRTAAAPADRVEPDDTGGTKGQTGATVPDMKAAADETGKLRGMSLKSKMFFLFFVFPIVVMAISSVLYLWQLNALSKLVTGESARVIQQLGEKIIAEASRSTAKQCKIYLDSHPELKKEAFNTNMDFRRIAVQKLGMTGYTALYQRPGKDGIWRTWAHVNQKIIGIDMSRLKNKLPDFWRIYAGVKEDAASQGYYKWRDQSGKVREKYMVCTPIMGTPYVIAATTRLDDFTRPLQLIKTRSRRLTTQARNMIAGILAGTLLLVGLIVLIYSNRLTGKIKALTEHAERISVGELDAELDVHSDDEIGALGEAITRMQDSIRLSIERLRKRRR